ncbi:MAG: hypothetical protein KF814_05615 [Nitrospiraceae bacterium]|nr:hypothetical protein [Nitrospiraceae bacterium]
MNPNMLRPLPQTVLPRPRQSPRLAWIAGTILLPMVGCVSTNTYEAARQQAKERYGELARTQADIQGLERQRDALHSTNRQDEQSLSNLQNELKNIQAAYAKIQKTNRDKLAALQQNIAALRARHQAMLKEISDTKRQENKLKSVTNTYEKVMGKTLDGPETQAEPISGAAPEQKLVAVVTPQSNPAEAPQAPASSAAASRPDLIAPPAAPVPAPASAPAPATSSAPATQAPEVAKAAPPAPRPTAQPVAQPAPQDESWLSSLTAWFSSLLDWIWA